MSCSDGPGSSVRSADRLLCLWLQGMVEALAENYHNIWAKKKKSDLGSRGDLLMNPIIDLGGRGGGA